MPEHRHRQNRSESGHQSDEESGGHYGSGHDYTREQDRLLPIANVSRVMKKALPANAKISKEAKETLQECVSEFISFITGEASDKCQREKRKTVNGDDLLWAMGTLGFGDYLEPLKAYLHKYREIEDERANMAKQSEQNISKDTGGMNESRAAVISLNGVMNRGNMPGAVQMMQPQGGLMYPQHQCLQATYQTQVMQGVGGLGRPIGGGGQVQGT